MTWARGRSMTSGCACRVSSWGRAWNRRR
jgi:hypothetical protein